MLDRGIPSHTYKFSTGTLNDNWYEQRIAPAQPLQTKPEEKSMRKVEPDISLLNANGVPAPLKRIKRNHPWNTKDIIPDDGYKEMQTINKTELKHPDKVKVEEKQKLRMINKYNIAELSLVDRPIAGPERGFGATVKRFDKGHGETNFSTTNNDFYGAPKRQDPTQTVTDFNTTQGINAGGKDYNPKRGVKKLSGLTGEVYNTSADPQEHTEIQRTWIYRKDNAIEATKYGKFENDKDKPYDNANSLPIGKGEHYYRSKLTNEGAFRHQRSDITRTSDDPVLSALLFLK